MSLINKSITAKLKILPTNNYSLNLQIKLLILIAILANATGMFFPCLKSMFSPYYGSIAKHIALTNNWNDLVLSGHDWLDKPHFPFWITALSFKILGINSFAYILPGFIFNLVGIYYTYRLARFWYSKEVGLIAALFTATALHVMLSSIDVRAEAYLIGQIIPACYYWLKYDQKAKLKYLLLGAFFTALAMMTKGIFTLITITSGIIILWIVQKRLKTILTSKWLIAIILSFLFIAPELFALYHQFDLQPAKIIFGQTHISGIKWFFWDSQFGRFFNTGPISVSHTEDMRYLFFVYTFFWAYLPWWPIFFVALWFKLPKLSFLCRSFMQMRVRLESTNAVDHNNILVDKKPSSEIAVESAIKESSATIFLLASFFVTFIIFSVTKFQIDHYTNILFPFASVIAANWFAKSFLSSDSRQQQSIKRINKIEISLAILLFLLITILAPQILSGIYRVIIIILIIVAIFSFIVIRKTTMTIKTLYYPTIAMCITFIFVMFINGVEYAKYDAGYQIAQYLNKQVNIEVVGYDLDLLSLDFNSQNTYIPLASKNSELASVDLESLYQKINVMEKTKKIYIVTEDKNKSVILNTFKHSHLDNIFKGTSIENYMRSALNIKTLRNKLTNYNVILINP